MISVQEYIELDEALGKREQDKHNLARQSLRQTRIDNKLAVIQRRKSKEQKSENKIPSVGEYTPWQVDSGNWTIAKGVKSDTGYILLSQHHNKDVVELLGATNFEDEGSCRQAIQKLQKYHQENQKKYDDADISDLKDVDSLISEYKKLTIQIRKLKKEIQKLSQKS